LVGPLAPAHRSLPCLVLCAAVAFCKVDVPEFSNGLVAGRGLAQPAPHQFSGAHIDMKTKLVLDVAGDRAPGTPGETEGSRAQHDDVMVLGGIEHAPDSRRVLAP